MDYSDWIPYSGSVDIPPDAVVSAQAISSDSGYANSSIIEARYEAIAAMLVPPEISPSADSFGFFANDTITVDLINNNEAGTSSIRYRIDGGEWMDYTMPFELQSVMYPGGVRIDAQAVPLQVNHYAASNVSKRALSSAALNLTGSAVGSFHSPTGQSNMKTNLSPGQSSSYFEWGERGGSGYQESSLDFNGSAFSDVNNGERFYLGNLNYFNGTIQSQTGADTVQFDLDLSVDINGNSYNPYFDFEFELLNTANLGDPDNPWPDADYVRIDDPRASRSLIFDGYEFEFRIEFGSTTPDGFSYYDEFHVLENRGADVNLYGTFVALGPVANTGPAIQLGQNTGVVDAVEAATEAYNDAIVAEAGARFALGDAERAKDGAKTAKDQARSAYESAKGSNNYDDAILYASHARAASNKAFEEADRADGAAADASSSATRALDAADLAYVLAQEDAGADGVAEKAAKLAQEAAEKAEDASIEARKAREEALRADDFATMAYNEAIALGGGGGDDDDEEDDD